VEDMRRGRIAQKGTPLPTTLPVLRHPGPVAPRGAQTADLETPRWRAMIDAPIVPLHGRPWAHDMGQRRREILAGACAPARPPPLPCGHDKGRAPGPDTMADVLGLPLRRLPRLRGRCGPWPLPHVPPGLCVCAASYAPVLIAAEGVAIALANIARLRGQGGGVTIEPIPTAMWCEVCCLHNPPAARATHQPPAMRLTQDGQQGVPAPACGPAVGRGGLCGGHRQAIDWVRGGEKRRGRPGRGASGSPASPCARYRVRHRRTGWRSQGIAAATRR
jgi:hypothetical protein